MAAGTIGWSFPPKRAAFKGFFAASPPTFVVRSVVVVAGSETAFDGAREMVFDAVRDGSDFLEQEREGAAPSGEPTNHQDLEG